MDGRHVRARSRVVRGAITSRCVFVHTGGEGDPPLPSLRICRLCIVHRSAKQCIKVVYDEAQRSQMLLLQSPDA
eukprot:6185063-Pleurochrysis_carterae.AAC.1